MDAKQTEELNRISNTLNSEFDKGGRRIVFWYDDGGKFDTFIDEMESGELLHAKIKCMEPTDTFYIKCLLESEDRDSNYLIYAPFARPDDADNHLTDTIMYSKVFNADALAMFMSSIKVPDKFRNVFETNKKVFDAMDRKARFSDLQMESFSVEVIELGILAVLCKSRSYSFDEIVKTLILDDLEDNKGIKEFERFGVLQLFWNYAGKYYGYNADQKNLAHLVTCLFITYTSQHLGKGKGLGASFKQFLCGKTNNCEVFVANFMKNYGCMERYDELADIVAGRVNIAQTIAKLPTEEIAKCDSFEEVDKEIIKRSVELLSTTTEIANNFSIIDERIKMHFGKKYEHLYKCISYAVKFLNAEKTYKAPSSFEDAVKKYATTYECIDRYYRKFYFHYDSLEDNSLFEKLKSVIENIYTNNYLKKSCLDFAPMLTDTVRATFSIKQQRKFYNSNVNKTKDRTIVIISDAFRYECAVELAEELKRAKCDSVVLEPYVASLPSFTQLGMAALLPHDNLTMDPDNDYRITVDGMPCNSIEARGKILAKYDENSVAVSFTDVINMTQEEKRSAFQKKNVIYIYHDQVDAASHTNENGVFAACDKAISEIGAIIKKLTGQISAVNFIVTADHGFIYKKDKIQESDKVQIMNSASISVNKRFILSKGSICADGTQCIPMNYILDNDSVCVTVPIGADIFKAPGGGQNFVHGGASLQELIIPVLKIHTIKSAINVEKAEITILDLSRKITNLVTYIEFIQTGAVSDTVKPATYRIFFETEGGETITNEELLVADKKTDKAEERVFRKKFSFKDMKYNKTDKFYLVIKDNDTNDEMNRFEFMIDIAFAGGFGF